jgi:hypothetical protein
MILLSFCPRHIGGKTGGGAGGGGGHPVRAPPLKLGKKFIIGRKIVIFNYAGKSMPQV